MIPPAHLLNASRQFKEQMVHIILSPLPCHHLSFALIMSGNFYDT